MSGNPVEPPRSVRWSCEHDLTRVQPDRNRQDEVLCAIEVALKYPERGRDFPGIPGLKYVTTEEIGGAPAMTAVYTFDDRMVDVVGVVAVIDIDLADL